ncbi:MAG: antirestriction protein ArdA [Flavobacteriaceae bacterium]|nr:antirestriction protein ArdA [Flavobacteriaceae bacterium]
MEFSIYVASLSHYNDGELVGKWINITDMTAIEIQKSIYDYMTFLGVEEWAIHDHEYLSCLYSEYGMDWEKVVEFIDLCKKYSYESVSAYVSNVGEDYFSKEGFEDSYVGQYDNEKSFAEEYLDESGELDSIPYHLQQYFDYDRYAYDLFINSHYFDNKFVFLRN